MRYVLQDAADRLGFEDVDIEEILGTACNRKTWWRWSPLCVPTVMHRTPLRCTSTPCAGDERGVAHEPDQPDHLLKMRSVKGIAGTRLSRGRNLKRTLIHELMEVCAADPRPQGLRDAAVIALLYGTGMRKSESVDLDLSQVDFNERSLTVTGKGNKQLIKYAPARAFAKLDAGWNCVVHSSRKARATMHSCSIAYAGAATSPASASPNTRFTTSPASAVRRSG